MSDVSTDVTARCHDAACGFLTSDPGICFLFSVLCCEDRAATYSPASWDAVPSALRGFTVEFGMGSGGAPSPWPPGRRSGGQMSDFRYQGCWIARRRWLRQTPGSGIWHLAAEDRCRISDIRGAGSRVVGKCQTPGSGIWHLLSVI
jgi:hypothetical protein